MQISANLYSIWTISGHSFLSRVLDIPGIPGSRGNNNLHWATNSRDTIEFSIGVTVQSNLLGSLALHFTTFFVDFTLNLECALSILHAQLLHILFLDVLRL